MWINFSIEYVPPRWIEKKCLVPLKTQRLQYTQTDSTMRSHPDSPYGKAWAQACTELVPMHPTMPEDDLRRLVTERTEEIMNANRLSKWPPVIIYVISNKNSSHLSKSPWPSPISKQNSWPHSKSFRLFVPQFHFQIGSHTLPSIFIQNVYFTYAYVNNFSIE